MKIKPFSINLKLLSGILLLLMVLSIQPFPVIADGFLIDDFETEMLSGTDDNGNLIGFYTFDDACCFDPHSSVAISRTDTPP